jgi:hypothetical protein
MTTLTSFVLRTIAATALLVAEALSAWSELQLERRA